MADWIRPNNKSGSQKESSEAGRRVGGVMAGGLTHTHQRIQTNMIKIVSYLVE